MNRLTEAQRQALTVLVDSDDGCAPIRILLPGMGMEDKHGVADSLEAKGFIELHWVYKEHVYITFAGRAALAQEGGGDGK